MKISASFLSAENKKKAIEKLNNTDVDYIHIDYMDGNFVEEKTGTFVYFEKLLKENKKPLDVHLMAIPNNLLIEKFAMLNTSFITIHVELENPYKYIKVIKEYGIKVGLSINPETPVEKLYPYLDDIDLILVMSVNPGIGGQEFLIDTYQKIESLKEKLKEKELDKTISVDGGIDDTINLDVDMIVVGSFITNEKNYQLQINKLKSGKNEDQYNYSGF